MYEAARSMILYVVIKISGYLNIFTKCVLSKCILELGCIERYGIEKYLPSS
jgi:hypothetical protein